MWSIAAICLLPGTARAIYPSEHFDYSTQIRDAEHLNAFLETGIGDSKAVLVRWIASAG